MCLLCATNPSTDGLAPYDLHDGASDGSIGSAGSGSIVSVGIGNGSGGSGSGGSHAPFTWDQIAGYLTDGYWGFNGGAGRAFELGAGRTITYDVTRLSPLAAAIAEYALDVWAAATGINFVDAGVTPSVFTETTDVGGTTGTATAITTNTIIQGSIGSSGEIDLYQVTLVAGQTYMIGMSRTDGSLVDPVLALLNAGGTVILESDDPTDWAAGEYITFTATTTGTYYIQADGWSTTTGGYELSIQTVSDLTFNDMDRTGAYAWSDITGNSILQSFINIHDSWDTLDLNGYMVQTYIHELGHALGLGHAGPYNGSADWGVDNAYDNDSWSATIMSYFDQSDNTFDPSDFAYLATIMPADIIAIQNLYGAGSLGYQTGNTVWGPGGNVGGTFQMLLNMWGGLTAINPLIYDYNPFAFTVYDTGGADTLDFSIFTQNQNIYLQELTRSDIGGLIGNVVIARGTVIENARGGSGNDLISGNNAANGLFGNAGNDRLYGGNGGDNLWGGLGADIHDGGDDGGIDYARYDDANYGNLVIRLDNPALNTGAAAGDSYFGIEGLVGGAGNDTIVGNAQKNYLFGSGGTDMVYGGGGNDYLSGDAGGDHLWGGAGADQHYGGDGIDFARYDDGNWGNLVIRLDNPALNTGAAAGDTYSGIEGVVGGLGNDTIVGDSAANYLYGNGGNDLVYGGSGNDTLYGDAGSDHMWGGLGFDAFNGGDGIDFARYDDANYGNLTLRLDNPALNTGTGAAGDTYNNIEGLVGGVGADVIIGNGAANWLYGGGGADYIDGLGGNDVLVGGAGADRFRFSTALGASNVDTIQDFQHGVDDILLSQVIFAAIGPSLTADEFRIGMAQDANDHILYNPGTGQLYYDSNGNAAGGMILFATVTPGTTLDVNDFIMA